MSCSVLKLRLYLFFPNANILNDTLDLKNVSQYAIVQDLNEKAGERSKGKK